MKPVYKIRHNANGEQNGSTWRDAFAQPPETEVQCATYRTTPIWLARLMYWWFSIFCFAAMSSFASTAPEPPTVFRPARLYSPKDAEQVKLATKDVPRIKLPPKPVVLGFMVYWNYRTDLPVEFDVEITRDFRIWTRVGRTTLREFYIANSYPFAAVRVGAHWQ